MVLISNFFIDFSMNEKINNEIAGIPDFKLKYLAYTNWFKNSVNGFLFWVPITTRIGCTGGRIHGGVDGIMARKQ